jgi:hypothetical protein
VRQACLGDIYDVTKGSDFYGPEGPYNNFAGRCALYAESALRALALSVCAAARPTARWPRCRSRWRTAWPISRVRACSAAWRICVCVLTRLSPLCAGLSLMEQDILRDWKNKFEAKYTKVGTVKR